MTQSIRAALQRARLRKQTAPLCFAFADRIDFLDGARWDRVTAHRGLLLQRSYFRELERVRPANLELRYALLCRGDEPVAALAMQIVAIDGGRLRKEDGPPKSGLRRLAARAVGRVAEKIGARVLVVGNVLTYGNHGIGEAAYRVRRAEKHAGSADFVLVKDLTASELTDSKLLHDLGYRSIETEPNMVLALAPAWQTHADYLAALSSSCRKNVRQRVLEPIDAAGLRVARIDDVAAAAPRLQELYSAVHERASLRPVTLGVDYWPALARAARDRVRFAALQQDQRLLGFIVTLRDDGDTAIGYHIGFDRAVAAELPLYLRLLQRSVEDGIALGARRLSLGRTALEPKAMLGARPEPLHVWVRHTRPVRNKLMRGLLGWIHHDEAPERNPFGKAGPAE